jgi:hypothetical protein
MENEVKKENKTVNFQMEYVYAIAMKDPVIGRELFRLNFPAPKQNTPNKNKNKKKSNA